MGMEVHHPLLWCSFCTSTGLLLYLETWSWKNLWIGCGKSLLGAPSGYIQIHLQRSTQVIKQSSEELYHYTYVLFRC